MAQFRHYDGFEDELGGLPFEELPAPNVDGVLATTLATVTGTADGDVAHTSTAAGAIGTVTGTALGTRDTPGTISTTFVFDAPASGAAGDVDGTAAGSIATVTGTALGSVGNFGTAAGAIGTVTGTTLGAPGKSGTISTTFVFDAPAVVVGPSEYGTISTTFAFSAPVDPTIVGLLRSASTVAPDRVGAQPAESSTSQTVATGASSLSAGAGTVLVGDYAFRALVTFDTTTTVPGNQADGRGYVTIGQWGDATLKVRREAGNVFEVRADFLTATATATWAKGFITIESGAPLNLGLGMTRDATTGTISLWKSTDSWLSWLEIPRSSRDFTAGALPDSVGDTLALLSGDFQDGAWLSIFQAQWAETDDIAAMDADEVAAWNYGSNIVTGLGGDFYDTIGHTAKDLADFGGNASYLYKLRSQVTSGGRTIRVDMTVNAPTWATGTPPAGTEAQFTLDRDVLMLDGPSIVVTSSRITFDTVTQFSVYGLEETELGDATGPDNRYRVILVDMNGTPTNGVLSNAVVTGIEWSLNEPESFTFILPTNDSAAGTITVPDQEVQVWRGARLLVWGVIVRSMANAETVEYQCRGLGWYFDKRLIGRPEGNYLWNPSFEDDTGWFFAHYAPTEPSDGRDEDNWDVVIDPDVAIDGQPGRSLRQWSNEEMTFGITTIQFFFNEIGPDDSPEGIVWTAVAWAYIPSVDFSERVCAYNWNGDSGPAGMTLLRMSTTEFEGMGDEEWADIVPTDTALPKVLEAVHVGLTDDMPKDQWVRLEVSLTQPNDGVLRSDWIQINLETPIGTVWWDQVSVTRNESLFFNNVDQSEIVEGLITHAQDPAYGKSDLNITPRVRSTGVNRTRTYEFFNRDRVSDTIAEFTELWKGMDWWIACTATDRFFFTYYPMKGTRRPAQALMLGRNIAEITIPTDGENTLNSIVMIADSSPDGSGREEIVASDTTGFASGLVLEGVAHAVKESGITTLRDQAERAWRQHRTPVTIPTVKTYRSVGGDMIASLQVGDVVPVSATLGSISLSGEYRVISMKLDPADETMELTLNPFEEWNDPTRNWGVVT